METENNSFRKNIKEVWNRMKRMTIHGPFATELNLLFNRSDIVSP